MIIFYTKELILFFLFLNFSVVRCYCETDSKVFFVLPKLFCSEMCMWLGVIVRLKVKYICTPKLIIVFKCLRC